MENITQLPITLNEAGDLVIRRNDHAAIEKLFTLLQAEIANQTNMLEEVGQDVGKLSELVGTQTGKVASLNQTVGLFDDRLTETKQANVAPRLIRKQLQRERHEKANHFVENTVQLTFEAIEGTKSDFERNVQVLLKKETTKVAKQIAAYVKFQLGFKRADSIDDIPNYLVKQHKQLLKELTWKKLDNFMKKEKR